MKLHDIIKGKFKVFARRQGLNQTDIAKKVGMDQSELSKRINGKLNLNTKDLEKIAKVLKVEPFELLKPEE